ncbi:hypothetical protein [Halostella litorea]|uniref:hypothetical protein n=1 Tax=Halostella litorea TaxID=2528831 RepID=UPI001092A5EB|nr:hypothetical protein [Halostella litorea]
MIDGLVIGVVFSLFGLLLFYGGVRKLLSGIALYRNDAIPVRQVAKSDGAVEFDGRAEPRADEGAFEAPFSGEPALCCEVWMEMKSRYPDSDEEGVKIYTSEEQMTLDDTETVWGLAESDGIRRPFAVDESGARVVVDPADADLDITGHMGEQVMSVGEGETLSEEARARLAALDGMDVGFDADPDTWDDEESAVKYREARLEPGDPVHVAGAAVESVPEEWGSGVDATVGASASDRFLVSRGTESEVVRRHFVQFVGGVLVGAGAFAVGARALWLALSL